MDISLKLAKLAKEKGFKIKTTKFYSDNKNGSRNSAEPRDVNSLKADEQYGEMYACVDVDVIKKWFKVDDGTEEDLITAIELVGAKPLVAVEPIAEIKEEAPAAEE